jgi:hypothetical protein
VRGEGQRVRRKDVSKGEIDLTIVQEEDRDLKEEAKHCESREVVSVEAPTVGKDRKEMVGTQPNSEEYL